MSALEPDSRRSVYDRIFWLSYFANFLLVAANAMTFRFAEFVRIFGGTEKVAGLIVGCGVVGALAGRLFLGQAIDRFGVRRLWLGVVTTFVLGCLAMAAASSAGGLLLIGRIVFAIGLAGMFTCSIYHAQNRAPMHRRTEVIGNLGSSGFLGMIAGSQLCDLLGRQFAGPSESVVAFGCVAGLGVAYLLLVVLITAEDEHVRPRETPPAHRLLMSHWPGPVVVVALAMGMYFTIPSVFLTRFSTHRGLGGIGTYWTMYAITAFLFRMWTRRWSQTVGRHRMILGGISGHLVGFLILPSVTSGWHLLLPAATAGFGHALLFPAVVSLGTEAFPKHYRGTGTTLVLGFFDLGGAIFAPILGAIIDAFGGVGFGEMYYTAAGLSAVIAGFYLLTGARRPDSDLSAYADRSAAADNDDTESHPAAAGPGQTAEKNAVVHASGR